MTDEIDQIGVDAPAKFPALQLRKANSPTTIKFKLTINIITARTLNLAIPPAVLTRADEVIQ